MKYRKLKVLSIASVLSICFILTLYAPATADEAVVVIWDVIDANAQSETDPQKKQLLHHLLDLTYTEYAVQKYGEIRLPDYLIADSLVSNYGIDYSKDPLVLIWQDFCVNRIRELFDNSWKNTTIYTINGHIYDQQSSAVLFNAKDKIYKPIEWTLLESDSIASGLSQVLVLKIDSQMNPVADSALQSVNKNLTYYQNKYSSNGRSRNILEYFGSSGLNQLLSKSNKSLLSEPDKFDLILLSQPSPAVAIEVNKIAGYDPSELFLMTGVFGLDMYYDDYKKWVGASIFVASPLFVDEFLSGSDIGVEVHLNEWLMAGFGWPISCLKPGNRPPQMVFLTVPMAVEYSIWWINA